MPKFEWKAFEPLIGKRVFVDWAKGCEAKYKTAILVDILEETETVLLREKQGSPLVIASFQAINLIQEAE